MPDHSLLRLAPKLFVATPMDCVAKDNSRSTLRCPDKARASMVLQGRYMGYMRQLKPRQKAQVRKIRATKGVLAAISFTRKMIRPQAHIKH